MSPEHGVFEIPLELPPRLEPERAALRETLVRAQRRVTAFAGRHGWGPLMAEPYVDRAVITADKPDFDRQLRVLLALDPEIELGPTFSAALEQRVLIAVPPEVYRRNYPEGDEPHAYEKLLAHEIAHRLHIRILDGDEDAMGPIWFFEGFALLAVDQFAGRRPALSIDQMQAMVATPERGPYARYAALLERLLTVAELPALVARAGGAGFADEVAALLGAL